MPRHMEARFLQRCLPVLGYNRRQEQRASQPHGLPAKRKLLMRRLLLALAWLAALTPVVAAGDSTPTVEQSLNLKTASTPRISPDGRFVAYQVHEANWADNAFKTEIWVAAAATGECYQLTHSKKSSSNPRWSP